jgi:hypothetical protein
MDEDVQLVYCFDDPTKGLEIWMHHEVDSLGHKSLNVKGGSL